jgi:Arm DNA-binding domain
MRLTKDAIERAKLPEPGRKERFIRDDVVRGLGVRITVSGAKSFIFEARIKGRPRRLTLGPWPDLTVVLARQRAMEIRAAIARGEDPAAEAEAARKELTFGDLTTYLHGAACQAAQALCCPRRVAVQALCAGRLEQPAAVRYRAR